MSDSDDAFRLAQSTATLKTPDYIIFALFLAISTGIGLYFMYKERKTVNSETSAEDSMFAGKSLTAFPVSMSLTASFMSALTMLGWPSEFYLYGTMFCWFSVTYLIVACITAFVFIPMFYNAGVNSTYEFLDKRYNSPGLRMMTEVVYILNTCLYSGIVCYAPALAINQVLGVSLWGGVLITAGCCTFYTCLGGLKAVVWTDVFQSLIMISGFAMIVIKGGLDFGLDEVWRIADEGGRIDFWQFDFDFTQRHTFWSIVVGGTLGLWLGTFACNQTEVQRYLSCKTEKDAKLSIFIAVGNLWILIWLGCFSGLVMYAYFSKCDPYAMGWVESSDQLIPYLVTEIFEEMPGLAGLYIASIYSGTLSTVSSGINSMATIALLDFVDPIVNFEKPAHRNLCLKGLVVFFGLCCCFCAFLADQLGGVLEAAMSVNGIIFGPTLGLFILAGFVKFTNKSGASFGYVCGIAMGTWIYIGSKVYPPTNEHLNQLDTTTEFCIIGNDTMIVPKLMETGEDYPGIAENWYSVSYMFYSTIGLFTTLILGCLMSVAAKKFAENKSKTVQAWLL